MRGFLVLMPLAAAGCAVLAPRPPAAPHYAVYFDPHSAQLDDGGKQAVAAAADMARKAPNAPITVGGFAAPDTGPLENRHLSAERAKAVADGLIADGVDPSRVHTAAAGAVDFSLDAIESRRVEITFGAP